MPILKLHPCPKCGSEDLHFIQMSTRECHPGSLFQYIWCNNCNTKFGRWVKNLTGAKKSVSGEGATKMAKLWNEKCQRLKGGTEYE